MRLPALSLLLPAVAIAFRLPTHAAKTQRAAVVMHGGRDFASLAASLQGVSEMQAKKYPLKNPFSITSQYVSGIDDNEPSFTRLFTHETWAKYTGRSSLTRWLVVTKSWFSSTVLKSTLPISMVAAIWAYLISSLPAALLPRTSPVPMSLMGTALGLLLVFRTNNSYLRLLEARSYWSESLICVREIAQGVATALLWDKRNRNNVDARDSAARVCRYLACFAWEMRARYMGGDALADTDVLHKLLPSDEADFIGAQRLRPLQLLAALRRELHDQYTEGWLPAHTHRKVRALLWCGVGRLPSGCVNRVCRRDPPPETCTCIPHVPGDLADELFLTRSLPVSVSVCPLPTVLSARGGRASS